MKRHDPQPLVWTPRGYVVVGPFVAVVPVLLSGAA